MKSKNIDMTYGSPLRHLIIFSLPTLFGNLFQQIYNLADSIIVGQFIGANAFAAVGSTTSITFLFFALCNGISNGGGIVASQCYGAHDDENVRKCIVNTGFIMLIIPVFFGVSGFILSPHLLRLLDTPGLILDDAVLYTRYMCIGLLFVSLYNYLSAMLKALGDSKTPLYFLILSTVVNIVLDIVMVCILSMGIVGAALATVISQAISVVLCSIHAYKTNPYFRIGRKDLVISGKMTYQVLRLGVPMSIQFALIAVSTMALQRVANSFGTTVVAAFTATNRIEQLIHQPYMTLATSISTFSGQNYGAKKNDRVYEGYKTGMILMAVLTAILLLTMQLFGKWITGLFVSDMDVIDLGALGLKITSIFYIALGTIYVVRGVLTGMGDAFFAFFNGVVEIIGRFTIPVFITTVMGIGEEGVWISSGIVWVLSAVTAWIRFVFYTKDYFKGKKG